MSARCLRQKSQARFPSQTPAFLQFAFLDLTSALLTIPPSPSTFSQAISCSLSVLLFSLIVLFFVALPLQFFQHQSATRVFPSCGSLLRSSPPFFSTLALS